MNTWLWTIIPMPVLLLISISVETLLSSDTGVMMHRLFGYLAMGALFFPLIHTLRKRLPVMATWGRLRTWLTAHEAVGLAGATAIVIHSGYTGGGTLTRIALGLALAAVLSGVVGTVIYHRILKLYHAH